MSLNKSLDELLPIGPDMPIKKYKKGRHLFSAGFSSDYLFVVKEGLVRHFMEDEAGTEFNLRFVAPSKPVLLGLEALEGDPKINYSSYAEAITPVQAQVISVDTLKMRMRDIDPYSGEAMILSFLPHLAENVRDRFSRRVMLQSQDVAGRLGISLLDMARTFSGNCDETTQLKLAGISQEVIAQYAGTTRVNVNKFLSYWCDLGVISFEGKSIVIKDQVALGNMNGKPRRIKTNAY